MEIRVDRIVSLKRAWPSYYRIVDGDKPGRRNVYFLVVIVEVEFRDYWVLVGNRKDGMICYSAIQEKDGNLITVLKHEIFFREVATAAVEKYIESLA